MNAALELGIRDLLIADHDLADNTILSGRSPGIIPGAQPGIFVS